MDFQLIEATNKDLRQLIVGCEEQIIRRCLVIHKGNKTRTAEALDITRKTLAKKITQYGIK